MKPIESSACQPSQRRALNYSAFAAAAQPPHGEAADNEEDDEWRSHVGTHVDACEDRFTWRNSLVFSKASLLPLSLLFPHTDGGQQGHLSHKYRLCLYQHCVFPLCRSVVHLTESSARPFIFYFNGSFGRVSVFGRGSAGILGSFSACVAVPSCLSGVCV